MCGIGNHLQYLVINTYTIVVLNHVRFNFLTINETEKYVKIFFFQLSGNTLTIVLKYQIYV